MTKSKKIFRYLFFILTLVLSSFVAMDVYADDVVVYNANTCDNILVFILVNISSLAMLLVLLKQKVNGSLV